MLWWKKKQGSEIQASLTTSQDVKQANAWLQTRKSSQEAVTPPLPFYSQHVPSPCFTSNKDSTVGTAATLHGGNLCFRSRAKYTVISNCRQQLFPLSLASESYLTCFTICCHAFSRPTQNLLFFTSSAGVQLPMLGFQVLCLTILKQKACLCGLDIQGNEPLTVLHFGQPGTDRS